MTTANDKRIDADVREAFRSAIDEAEQSIAVEARLAEFTAIQTGGPIKRRQPANPDFGKWLTLGGAAAAACGLVAVVGTTYFASSNTPLSTDTDQEVSAAESSLAASADSENFEGQSAEDRGNRDQTDFSDQGTASDQPESSTPPQKESEPTTNDLDTTDTTEPGNTGTDATPATSLNPSPVEEPPSERRTPTSTRFETREPSAKDESLTGATNGTARRSGPAAPQISTTTRRSISRQSTTTVATKRVETTRATRRTTTSSRRITSASRRSTSTQQRTTSTARPTTTRASTRRTSAQQATTSRSTTTAPEQELPGFGSTATTEEPTSTTRRTTTTRTTTTTSATTTSASTSSSTSTTEPEANTCTFSITGGSLNEAIDTIRAAGCDGSILIVPAEARGSLASVIGGRTQTVDRDRSITLLGYSNVPKLIGLSPAAAADQLSNSSLSPIANYENVPADDPRIGSVISQSPNSQTRQPARSAVRYTVAISEPTN